MKNTILLIALLSIITPLFAQTNFNAEIKVENRKNGKTILNATLADKRMGKFINAEKGVFEIYYNQKMLGDTLFIDAQGFQKLKIPLYELLQIKKASLLPQDTSIPVLNSTHNNVDLNEYDTQTVSQWIGLPLGDKPFEYLQVGQIFENKYTGAQLNNIKLNQLYFDLPPNNIYDDGSMNSDSSITYANKGTSTVLIYQDKDYMHSYAPSYIQQNKFKLRIYQLDKNNQPAAELCITPILIDREPPAQNMRINLSKYKIALPQGKFMVAVEWVPSLKNLNYITWSKSTNPMGIALRPFVGVSNKKGERLNVMALDYGGNWVPFEYLLPYYTDLAISCEIGY
ncbi:hypothetical protein EZJ43_13870 [Pedobacter changchengzhani]|uniref:Carboxypeptidase regulatory-like domain-containing protein n=1 Tax=Pedobacter changchengzhani TaxID=2529274 RepID=A0A4R5MIP4_9SPHI|nr:hypothetical protein [Pedobacter changchengzhani]TDG35382.1 hypothetical protein EZJ43_13870 [Pedobacter changchengzhani]